MRARRVGVSYLTRFRTGVTLAAILTAILPACAASRSTGDPQRVRPSEKDSRTPAQRKINSQLLYELYRFRGQAREKQVPPEPTGVKIDPKHRALVDVRAEVTPALEKKVRGLGGTVESVSRQYRSIVAWIPLTALERLAADPAVRAIEPKAEATTIR
jgi:hypothetical protein